AGVAPAFMAVLYLVSDIVLAVAFEPFVRVVAWLGRYLPPVAWLVGAMRGLAARSGATAGGAKGPIGLILVSFGINPMTGRAAAAAAGHGFIPGWSLAIAGDMIYFLVLMASTLWLEGVLRGQRLPIGGRLVLMLVLPTIVRRLSRRVEERPRSGAVSRVMEPRRRVGR